MEFAQRTNGVPTTGRPLTPSLSISSGFDPQITGNLAAEEAVARSSNGRVLRRASERRGRSRRSSWQRMADSGELPLRLGRTVVGRTPDNDLQIDSRFVSRHHCQIITTRDSCVIEDLNSTNGILVKSKRVRHHNLNDGDVVTIGRARPDLRGRACAADVADDSPCTGRRRACALGSVKVAVVVATRRSSANPPPEGVGTADPDAHDPSCPLLGELSTVSRSGCSARRPCAKRQPPRAPSPSKS